MLFSWYFDEGVNNKERQGSDYLCVVKKIRIKFTLIFFMAIQLLK